MFKDLKYLIYTAMFFTSFTVFAVDTAVHKSKYNLERFVKESLKVYPALKIAKLNLDRLELELGKAASQLGWVLTGQGGFSRNSSSFGIQSDVVDFGVGLEKLLESGDTLSLNGDYEHVDSDAALFSLLPNPSDTTNLSINYRMPILEGVNNLKYSFSIDQAEINKKISELKVQKIRDTFILKLTDIFYSISILDARYRTAMKSLERTKKLRLYIKNNIDLGLLEKGEILQINSQIYTLKLELQKISDLKEQQTIAINRFLKRPFLSNFETVDSSNIDNIEFSRSKIIENVKKYSVELKENNLQLELLDSALALSRDREKSKLDIVMSVGVQNRSGPSSTGEIDDTVTTGMVRLEYRAALDKRTFNSERLQIQIDREKNKEEGVSLIDDLEYETNILISRIIKSKNIVKLSQAKNKNETDKYKDIFKRYKGGRATTNTVIQFDNERIRAELDYDTERYELEKIIESLNIKQGLYFNEQALSIN